MVHRSRAHAALALAAALLVGCGSTAAPSTGSAGQPSSGSAPAQLTKINLQMPWVPSAEELPFFLGVARGYFKQQGLDVTLIDGKGSLTTTEMVGSGTEAQIGYASLDATALARAKGVPVIAVMGGVQLTPFGVLVPKDSSLHKLSDLVGHTVLVTPGSPETFYLPAAANKEGFDIHSVHIIDSNPANKVTQYIAGKADAMGGDVGAEFPQVNPRRPSRVIPFADSGLIAPSYGVLANTEYLTSNKSNGDLVRRFVAASVRSWQAILSDPGAPQEAIDDMMAARPGVKLEGGTAAVLAGWDLYAKSFITTPNTKGHPFGWESAADWQAALGVLHDFAGLKGNLDPSYYFTNAYLPGS